MCDDCLGKGVVVTWKNDRNGCTCSPWAKKCPKCRGKGSYIPIKHQSALKGR